ncbi:MAG: aminotransferase class I/II-fold pyridoxal phosphate-dependent enzyme [Clostridia bacterium]|nr:aminotransferase class I/II-fold pyridoxal phosphate-dependent enzyme [Clostridia bacterium]
MALSRDQKCELLKKSLTFENFFDVMCREPGAVAEIWLEKDRERQMTYEEFRTRVLQTAARIQDAALGSRDGWVGLCLETQVDWPVLFWALLASGRKPLLLDPMLRDEPLRHLMIQAGAAALITGRRRESLTEYAQRTPDELTSGVFSKDFVPCWADRIALCTSGTTSTSRVFVYDGRAVCLQSIAFVEQQKRVCMTSESFGRQRMLCFLPLNHVFGMMTNLFPGMLEGNPQVFLHDRAPETILKTCRTCRVEFILAVPMLINGISAGVQKKIAAQPVAKRAAFRTLQRISLTVQKVWPAGGLWLARNVLFKSINAQLFGPTVVQIAPGGASAPYVHLRTMAALGYNVSFGYGMTETAVTAYDGDLSLKARLSGSNGQLLPVARSRVDEKGELIIGSDAIHIGQLQDGRLVPPDLDENGMFRTGDLVRFDKKGRLYIEGRVKDVIIGASGENIYPDEVENAFSGLEGVDMMTVLGTGDRGREQVTLVLSLGDRLYDGSLRTRLKADVDARNRTLPAAKQARVILVTDRKLPLSGTMKVKRVELRARIEDGSFPCTPLDGGAVPVIKTAAAAVQEPVQPSQDEIEKKVLEFFAEALSTDQPILPTAHFINDLGGDSLQMLSVMLKIEETYGVLLEEEDTAQCTCARDVANVVRARLHGDLPARHPEAVPGKVKPITRVEDMPEYQALQQRLRGLRGENPYFVCHESAIRDTSIVNGQEVLNFGSYNYAGMSGRPETVQAAIDAARKYGTSASGSRLLGGEKKLHEQLEAAIARWKHTEDAVVLVSGHATNVTFVGNFCGKGDLIVYDALAHNSVHEGCRLSDAVCKAFPHNDVAALESILRTQRDKFAKVLIVCEGAYSMDGDIAPIPDFVRLKKQYGCFLMVDEAHSAGVLGKTGAGVDEYFGLEPADIDIKMGTLSKGLGTCGGYLAGSRALCEHLRYNLPGFVFSVGLSPALAGAALKAVELLRTEPEIMENLQRNIRVFLEEAHKRQLDTCLAGHTAIIPILIGNDSDAFELSVALGHKGVFVPPAVYPAVPRNSARLRFCVISEHKPEQIIKALDTLVETADEMGIDIRKRSVKPAAQ